MVPVGEVVARALTCRSVAVQFDQWVEAANVLSLSWMWTNSPGCGLR